MLLEQAPSQRSHSAKLACPRHPDPSPEVSGDRLLLSWFPTKTDSVHFVPHFFVQPAVLYWYLELHGTKLNALGSFLNPLLDPWYSFTSPVFMSVFTGKPCFAQDSRRAFLPSPRPGAFMGNFFACCISLPTTRLCFTSGLWMRPMMLTRN